MNEYLLGQQLRWTVTFRTTDGTPTTPDALVMTLTRHGAVSAETLTPVLVEPGVYRVDVLPALAGYHTLRAVATGGVNAAIARRFVVVE
jgi:hypothetical protein